MNEVFTRTLQTWGRQNRRSLPWVGEKDPYRIWLSEVILQQTRVEQGLPYYQRFLARFPDVHSLARASDDEVFKVWEGLGYYSRCRNLLRAAREVAGSLKGVFPTDYEGLRALAGIGEYTAAAIASFAYALPHAVLDGNVFRVLARYYGIAELPGSTSGRKAFRLRADAVLDLEDPGGWNQSIMDFGSQICKPRQALCASCPLASTCVAFSRGMVAELPLKKAKAVRKRRFFHYLLLEQDGAFAVRRREEGDIWAGLYEFPLIEKEDRFESGELLAEPGQMTWFKPESWRVKSVSEWFGQTLSHQQIEACFIHLQALPEPVQKKSADGGKLMKDQHWQAAGPDLIRKLPFPKIIARYLNEQG